MSKEVKRYDCTDGGARFCQGCYTMSECEFGEYVSWDDYEALLAERDALSRWKQTAEYWYGQYRLAKYVETPADHPVEGALDAWHNAYHGAQP